MIESVNANHFCPGLLNLIKNLILPRDHEYRAIFCYLGNIECPLGQCATAPQKYVHREVRWHERCFFCSEAGKSLPASSCHHLALQGRA